MPQPPSVSTLSKFGLDTVNPVTKAFEYMPGSFTLGKRGTVLETGGIRGTRSRHVERTRGGIYTVSGSIGMQPGPTDLDTILPLITGGLKQGDNTFPLVDSFTTNFANGFWVTINRIAQTHTFAGCAIDKATFRAQAGGFLELSLDVEGKTEALGAVAGFDALVPSLTVPYVLMDAGMTYGGVTHQFNGFELVFDNMLKKDRHMNSITRTDLPSLDRIVSVSLTLPYTSDQNAVYDDNETAAAVIITLTNGTVSLTFSMPAVQFPTQPPDTPGREEILLPLNGQARKTGSTPEITITNDSTA